MIRTSPQIKTLARRVLAIAPRDGTSVAESTSVTFHAIVRLRPQLAVLMGNGGMRALLLRALVLASVEVPWLREIRVDASAALQGLDKPLAQLPSKDFLEGKVVLLAQVFGLMEAFIGARLTLRLVQEAWPDFPVSGLDLGKGDKSAEEK
jgi:hypothetical protein